MPHPGMPAHIRVAKPYKHKAPTCIGIISSSWVLEIALAKAFPLSRERSGQATVPFLVCSSRDSGIVCHARKHLLN